MNLRWKVVPVFLSTLILITTVVIVQGLPMNVLLNDLKHFNMNRHHVTNPNGKDQARAYIRDTLTSLGLHTWIEPFIPTPGQKTYYPYIGNNIVAVLPGRLYKTIHDRLILIGAHYDTMRHTHGTDDDGSGVVAMLHVARLLTKKSSRCTRKYSVMFVAFDFEEWEGSNVPDCACAKLGCGSRAFLANFSHYARYGHLQGAVIMDTMMNYDTTPYSQNVPPAMENHFPKQYKSITQNMKRGDFLLATGRERDDKPLADIFEYFYDIKGGRKQDHKYKLQVFRLPFEGTIMNLPIEYQQALSPFLRSDHVSFWNMLPYKAIFLSDTANMRGYMRHCYHKNCDTLSHVTKEALGFLSKSCDTIVMTTDHLTQVRCRNGRDSLPNDEGLTSEHLGAIGGGITSFVVVTGLVAAGYTRYRRRSNDPDALVTNDQLEELDGSDESDVPLLDACGNQTSEA